MFLPFLAVFCFFPSSFCSFLLLFGNVVCSSSRSIIGLLQRTLSLSFGVRRQKRWIRVPNKRPGPKRFFPRKTVIVLFYSFIHIYSLFTYLSRTVIGHTFFILFNCNFDDRSHSGRGSSVLMIIIYGCTIPCFCSCPSRPAHPRV